MQTGGAMPFVTFGTSNVDDEGNTDISLTLTNNGVGPAILGPIEIRYQGKPIATPVDLLESCCGATDARGLSFATSPSRRIAIRPGERIELVSLPRPPAPEKVWPALNAERWMLDMRTCHCPIYNASGLTERREGLDQ